MPAPEVVLLGASMGGLDALHQVLDALPGDLPVPVVIVQHRMATSDTLLEELLDRRAALKVCEAEDKMPLRPGYAVIAPAGYHLLVEDGHVALSTDELVHYSRPSLDVAFESAAEAYGAGVMGVVLTGANDDGAAGLAAVRRRGGLAVVQDPATAVRAEMPRAALAAARPQAVLALEEIGPYIAARCSS